MLSGYLFNSDKYNGVREFLTKKTKSLVIPYLIVACITLMFHILINKVYWQGLSGFADSENLKYLIQIFIAQGSPNMRFNTPLWFVLCLFIVEIIYYFIAKIPNLSIMAFTIVFCVLIGWYLESSLFAFGPLQLPWSIDSALFALGFYAIGNFVGKYTMDSNSSKWKNKRLFLLVTAIISLVVLIPLALYNGSVSMGSKRLNNGFLFYITGVLGSISVINLSMLISRFRLLEYIGRKSFYIMAFHIPCMFPLPILWSKVEKETGLRYFNKDNAFECILPFIYVSITCLVIVFILEKVKEIFKRLKGLRTWKNY